MDRLSDLSPNVDLYVSNHNTHIVAAAAKPEDQDGSINKPFVNFEDVLTRMDELVG